LLFLTPADIDSYLIEVKDSIQKGKCRFELNDKRPSNIQLYTDYVLSEEESKQILLSLQAEDFSETVKNEHKGYEHEILYVFGKTVTLLERFGTGEKQVSLYIKINKLESNYIIIISFHEAQYKMKYAFK
jgi:hypothetical protein